MIRLVYLAWVRERLGTADETLPLAAPTTLGALLDTLATHGVAHAALLADRADRAALRFAVDGVMASAATPVAPGAEVAIFPPVTGG